MTYESLVAFFMVKEALCPGQAVVQIVEESLSRIEYAMKFFFSSRTFVKERDIYMDK